MHPISSISSPPHVSLLRPFAGPFRTLELIIDGFQPETINFRNNRLAPEIPPVIEPVYTGGGVKEFLSIQTTIFWFTSSKKPVFAR